MEIKMGEAWRDHLRSGGSIDSLHLRFNRYYFLNGDGGTGYDTSIDNQEQILDADSVVIRWVNADLVVHIISKAPGRNNFVLAGRV